MTVVDLSSCNKLYEPIRIAKTTAPVCPGHAAAQAWYACLVERLAMEQHRQGVSALVTSNILPIYDGLREDAQRDFVSALGALVADTLVSGEPNIGRWDPLLSIEEAIASENQEVAI